MQAGIGAEVAAPAGDGAGDLQGGDVTLFQPQSSLQSPGPQGRLIVAIDRMHVLPVAEMVGHGRVDHRLAGGRIDVVADIVEAVAIVLQVVAQLQLAIVRQGQVIVGAELRLHQVQAQMQVVEGGIRGGQVEGVGVGVAFPFAGDAVLQREAQRLLRPPQLLFEMHALAGVLVPFMAVAVAVGDAFR